MPSSDENRDLAAVLRQIADLLHAQQASPFRVRAYRRAADVVIGLDEPIREVYQRAGSAGLQALPAIGAGIAQVISGWLETGRFALLEQLRGSVEPEALFRTLPGIGKELAERLHEELEIGTLEELEVAAHDGRLRALPGFGERRVAALIDVLDSRLRRRRPRVAGAPEPSVAELLDVDAQYRRQAEADRLPKIAPRRFNPTGAAWLPILHTERGGCEFTALFSNTARAHRLGRERDWVVIYFLRDHREGQRTVVTETHGPDRGRRVVRGRERECREHYSRQE